MRKVIVAMALAVVFQAEAQKDSFEADSLSVNTLDPVVIHSSFSKKKFSEPVSLSTVSADEIRLRSSNQEFPEILKSTPSVYASKQGGGFGDSRLTLRGFGSENIALLINGIPVNGMENGAIYWSNWAALSDVARSVQVQRGIGLSRMGLYSVGGTVNILTQSTSLDPEGSLYYMMGNDGFQKRGFGFSTGELESGWSATISGSYTSGDGYVQGTAFESYSYFVEIAKRLGKNHRLAFTAFGASQWHNRRSNKHLIEDYETHKDGIRMNTSYGYLHGKVLPTYSGYNEYHKPQLSLSHYWNISPKALLTTSLYASVSSGGGRKVYGADANRLQYNYKSGRPYENSSLTPDGYIDYEPVMEDNKASETGSRAIFTMGTNAHDWYGFLSNYVYKFTQRLSLTAGLDARYYKGYHYDEITDLLGGAYYLDSKLAWRDPATKLGVGDRVNQDYVSYIYSMGAYGQLQYETEHINGFVSLYVTDQRTRRRDPGKYGKYGNQNSYPASEVNSGWHNFVPISVKGGFNYQFTPRHRAYVNAGYVTRTPMFENQFVDNNDLENLLYEKISTVELGYGFRTRNFDLSVAGYYIKWMDKSTIMSIGGWGGPKAVIPNIDARHMGVEITAEYAPIQTLRFRGNLSLGDWRWLNNIDFTYYDAQDVKVGEYKAYIKDLHVGDAPQTSLYLSVSYDLMKNFTLGADFNYYGRFYSKFTPTDRVDASQEGVDSWKIPSFGLIDLNAQYRMKLKYFTVEWYGNVNNLFNRAYICDADDGVAHKRSTALVWYGAGRTWTVGMRVGF